jgi:5-bromo-4-chloroindolyl phosphate hydrolysis protein
MKKRGKMFNEEELYGLGHLIITLEELTSQLEKSYSERNNEKVNSIKKEILSIQKKIEGLLK